MKTLITLYALIISVSCFAGRKPSTPALYPGGDDAMKGYLRDSVRYPDEDRKNGIEGIVFVSFVVNEDGIVEGAKPYFSVGGSSTLQAEAVRLILAMPEWDPATSKGKPTASNHTCEVRFELPDSLIHFLSDTTRALKGEVMPEFIGGAPAMQQYIFMTLRYPHSELEQGKEGTVYVRYAIGKNGKVYNVRVAKSVPGAPGLDKEAVRVVESFPRHKPGTIDGKPVIVEMTIPIKFVLQ